MQDIEKLLDFGISDEPLISKWMLITPSIAKIMLANNTKFNRNINEKKLSNYSKYMKDNIWNQQNPEMIIFTKDFQLIEGQHRLLAVIKSNNPTMFYVYNDACQSIFDVLNTGKNRNSKDIFSINGVLLPGKKSACSSVLNKLNNKFSLIGRGLNYENIISTPHCLYEYYIDRRIYIEKVDYHIKITGFTAGSYIHGVYAYLLQFEKDDLVFDFFNKLQDGTNMEKDNPIMVLRDTYICDLIKSKRIRMSNSEKLAKLLKAFYLYAKGSTSKIIRYSDHGSYDFPYHKLHDKNTFSFNCK